MIDTEQRWTRRSLLERIAAYLEAAGVEDARRNAEWMLQEVLGCGRALLHAYPEAVVTPDAARRAAAFAEARSRRVPLQYVLGYTEFFGLRLHVSPAVLIPRPETEQVVETVLALVRGYARPRVLDVGTGSGCIPLAVKHMLPTAVVAGCDVSPEALACARANGARLGLDVDWCCADVLSEAFSRRVPGELDLLVSNPPYVTDEEAEGLAPEVRDYEPSLALFSGEDPLRFYRAITSHAARLLKKGGWLVYETHADYGADVAGLLAGEWEKVSLKPDLTGRPRIVTARKRHI